MTETWSTYVGRFETLRALVFRNDLAKALYLAILAQKDELVSNQHYDTEEQNPLHPYETYDQATHPPKKGQEKYTYKGVRKIKDNATGVTMDEEGDIPLKKFITITIDGKLVLVYLLNAFLKEVKSFYDKNKCMFPEDKALLGAIAEYARLNLDSPVFPLIYKLTNSKTECSDYTDITKKIFEKVRPNFKSRDDKIPDGKLKLIINCFCRFMDVFAKISTDRLYYCRQAVNKSFMLGVLGTMFSIVEMSHAEKMPRDVLNLIQEYVQVNMPKKAETSKDGKEKKKKTPAKKKEKVVKKEEEEEEEEHDIEEAVNDDDPDAEDPDMEGEVEGDAGDWKETAGDDDF